MSGLWERLLSLLYPQRNLCHACGVPLVAGEGVLCASCVRMLARVALPLRRAPALLNDTVAFAASAYTYAGTASALVKRLKFNADHTAALPLAERMAALYAAFAPLRTAEFCVPCAKRWTPANRKRAALSASSRREPRCLWCSV